MTNTANLKVRSGNGYIIENGENQVEPMMRTLKAPPTFTPFLKIDLKMIINPKSFTSSLQRTLLET